MHFDPHESTSGDDPYGSYAELRDEHPVFWSDDQKMWVLSRHADVQRALLAPTLFSSAQGIMPNGFTGEVPMLLMIDPPRHDAVRKTVQRAFARQRLRALEPRVREIVDGCVEALARDGGGDACAQLAVPVPIAVISQLLGVEVDDQDRFVECCDAIITGLDGTTSDVLDAQRELLGYFDRVFPERRAHPGPDLISELLPEVDASAISEAELLGLCFLILIAGTETTTNGLSSALVLLDRFPDVRAGLERVQSYTNRGYCRVPLSVEGP